MAITAQQVQALREKTNVGLMDCKRALEEADGDPAAAEVILRKRGIATAAKKAGRTAREGVIASYIHMGGKMGVLVEINCETDFVAKTDAFREFVKDIGHQVAASKPMWISREQVPKEVTDKMAEGNLEKFYSTVCLLEQAFIKNTETTIREHLTAKIAELGENIVIKRFTIYELGQAEG